MDIWSYSKQRRIKHSPDTPQVHCGNSCRACVTRRQARRPLCDLRTTNTWDPRTLNQVVLHGFLKLERERRHHMSTWHPTNPLMQCVLGQENEKEPASSNFWNPRWNNLIISWSETVRTSSQINAIKNKNTCTLTVLYHRHDHVRKFRKGLHYRLRNGLFGAAGQSALQNHAMKKC